MLFFALTLIYQLTTKEKKNGKYFLLLNGHLCIIYKKFCFNSWKRNFFDISLLLLFSFLVVDIFRVVSRSVHNFVKLVFSFRLSLIFSK